MILVVGVGVVVEEEIIIIIINNSDDVLLTVTGISPLTYVGSVLSNHKKIGQIKNKLGFQ